MQAGTTIFVVAAFGLAGCTQIRTVDGFDALAASSDVVSIDGAGWGRSGTFAVAPVGAVGRFRRTAQSSTHNGERLSDGALHFQIEGNDEFGGLSAECAYSRETFDLTEEVSRRTTVTTSFLTGPYVMTCGYFRAGEAIGRIAMHEERSADIRTLRSGRAEIGDSKLGLTSVHAVPGLALDSGEPLGYAMDYASGGQAMLFANGGDRRIALPRTGRDERAAALLSGIALSLMWEPSES